MATVIVPIPPKSVEKAATIHEEMAEIETAAIGGQSGTEAPQYPRSKNVMLNELQQWI